MLSFAFIHVFKGAKKNSECSTKKALLRMCQHEVPFPFPTYHNVSLKGVARIF